MQYTITNSLLKKNRIVFILSIAAVLAACKKDTERSVTQKLMQKWNVVQTNDTFYTTASAPQITTYAGRPGDYWDFRTNGKLYAAISNSFDTAAYTYSEIDMKLFIRTLHYQILLLTEDSLVLFEPHFVYTPDMYLARKIILNR